MVAQYKATDELTVPATLEILTTEAFFIPSSLFFKATAKALVSKKTD